MLPNDKELLKFLNSQMVASLATVRPNGQPHVSTIYFLANADLKFFFVTKDKTVKFQNLQKNPAVALTIADEKTLDTVQVEGVVHPARGTEFLTAVEGMIERVIKVHKRWDKIPVSLLKAGHFSFFVVEPTWIRWMSYQDWTDTVKFEYKP